MKFSKNSFQNCCSVAGNESILKLCFCKKGQNESKLASVNVVFSKAYAKQTFKNPYIGQGCCYYGINVL